MRYVPGQMNEHLNLKWDFHKQMKYNKKTLWDFFFKGQFPHSSLRE